MVMPGTEVGLFGGLQDAQPTFFGPSNTNYFIGFEGRQFFGPAMIGGQIGRFDAIDKPGTFTNAWFGEARAHLSVGHVVDIPALVRTIISGDVGYGSGTASLTSTGAQTTYWGAQLSHGIANTPFSVFVEYQHFENRVDGLGKVWNENMLFGGLKVLFPDTQTEPPLARADPPPALHSPHRHELLTRALGHVGLWHRTSFDVVALTSGRGAKADLGGLVRKRARDP
jgi:hypothetical protein